MFEVAIKRVKAS